MADNVRQFCVRVEGVHGLTTVRSQVCRLGTSSCGLTVEPRGGRKRSLREPFAWGRGGICAVMFSLKDCVHCLTLDSRFDEAVLSLIIESQR